MSPESPDPPKISVGRIFIPPGTYSPSESEIMDFARQWDPFPWHMDKAAAEQSHFRGLTAPGVMVDAILIRLIHSAEPHPPGAFLGMMGAEDVRYLQPVRPGDELSARGEVVSMRRSASNPARTVGKVRWEVRRADGTIVYARTNVALWGSAYCAHTE